MKSDVIEVSSLEDKTDQVLAMAEQVAEYHKLSHKNTIHLRLLTEEMMGMMRAITGGVNGKFWIETQNNYQFELHLQVTTRMDPLKRSQLLSASTSGENEANRGFMGKIRAFFEPMEDLPLFVELRPDGMTTDMTWSMQAYQQHLQEFMKQNRDGAAKAWDELERSVIAHVADEVKVRIQGFIVEMTAFKEMA